MKRSWYGKILQVEHCAFIPNVLVAFWFSIGYFMADSV